MQKKNNDHTPHASKLMSSSSWYVCQLWTKEVLADYKPRDQRYRQGVLTHHRRQKDHLSVSRVSRLCQVHCKTLSYTALPLTTQNKGGGFYSNFFVLLWSFIPYRPFDYCFIDPDGGVVTPMWSWLEKSYYKLGVFKFKGKLLGVWTYEVGYWLSYDTE